MPQPKDKVVGGIGNPLMTDEGIGCYVVRELTRKSVFSDSVDFEELGSSFMNIVHAIAGRQKVILVDCAFMNESAGVIRRFTPDNVISIKATSPFSFHEGNLFDALTLSRKLGEYPNEVVIFGIQPERVTEGDSLSPLLHHRLGEYVEAVSAELRTSS